MWSYAMVLTHSCGITTVGVFLAGLLGKKESAMRQQLREWCYDAQDKKGQSGKGQGDENQEGLGKGLGKDKGKGYKRQSLDVSTCFVPLLRWVLAWWSPQETRIALAFDATLLRQQFAVLVVSVVYRGCAIPVAWKVVRASTKGAWRPHIIQLFQLLAPAIPAEWTVIVLADRGLYARWLYRQIVSNGWHPFLRINRGAKYRLPDAAEWRYIDTVVPQVGTTWSGAVVCFSSEDNTLRCTLLAAWSEGYDDAWFVLTDLAPEVAEIAWYSMRSWIEGGFKDLKRGGWGWHQTKMQDPARAERLWLAMAVATLWVVSVGGQGEVRADLPASSLTELPLLHVARVATRQVRARRVGQGRVLSCFARGLIDILVALLHGRPLPLGRFVPEPWPDPWSKPNSLSPSHSHLHPYSLSLSL
jgi:hypothetical protein